MVLLIGVSSVCTTSTIYIAIVLMCCRVSDNFFRGLFVHRCKKMIVRPFLRLPWSPGTQILTDRVRSVYINAKVGKRSKKRSFFVDKIVIVGKGKGRMKAQEVD